MSGKLFSRPVFIRMGKHLVHELATIDDAIEFLEDWPLRDRDLIHETVLRACIEAHDGYKPLNVARDAIRTFAVKKGILEDPASVMPWLKTASSGDVGRST